MLLTLGTSSSIHISEPPVSGQFLFYRKPKTPLRFPPTPTDSLLLMRQVSHSDVASVDGISIPLVSPVFKPRFGPSPEPLELPKPPDPDSSQVSVKTNITQTQGPGGVLVSTFMSKRHEVSLNPRVVTVKPFMCSISRPWPDPWMIMGFLVLISEPPQPPDLPDPPSKSVGLKRLSPVLNAYRLQNWSQFLVIDRIQFLVIDRIQFYLLRINSVRCFALVNHLRSQISLQKLVVRRTWIVLLLNTIPWNGTFVLKCGMDINRMFNNGLPSHSVKPKSVEIWCLIFKHKTNIFVAWMTANDEDLASGTASSQTIAKEIRFGYVRFDALHLIGADVRSSTAFKYNCFNEESMYFNSSLRMTIVVTNVATKSHMGVVKLHD